MTSPDNPPPRKNDPASDLSQSQANALNRSKITLDIAKQKSRAQSAALGNVMRKALVLGGGYGEGRKKVLAVAMGLFLERKSSRSSSSLTRFSDGSHVLLSGP